MLNNQKIVHMLGTLKIGGAQHMSYTLASAPELKRFEHIIMALIAKDGSLHERFNESSVSVCQCPIEVPPDITLPSWKLRQIVKFFMKKTFYYRLLKMTQRIEPALLHTHLAMKVETVIKVATVLNIPVIWTVHGMYISRRIFTKSQIMNIYKKLAVYPKTCIVGVSQSVLDDIMRYNPGYDICTRVIYNGIDLKKFSPNTTEEPLWKKELGIPEDAIVFGSTGRLVPLKRFDLFIDAAAEILKFNSNIHFAIAGDGGERERLEKKIRDYSVKNNFHLLGYQSDVPRFLKGIDVFVLPSSTEGHPLSLIEAMAMGKPCIATRVGGVPEVLGEDGGIMIEPNSKEDLVRAMKDMLDPDVRVKYADKAQEIARRFSVDRMVEEYKKLYEELIEKSKKTK